MYAPFLVLSHRTCSPSLTHPHQELRRLLVDPLPVGSKLTAVFDACHSGTLLDLNHYLCNEIVFPSTSRGLRRPFSRWMNVRECYPRLAMVALMLNRIEDVGRKDGHGTGAPNIPSVVEGRS